MLPPRRELPPIPHPPPSPIFPAGGKLGNGSQTDVSLLLLNPEDAEEDGLTEKQLRELYNNEEMDWFLTFFSDICTYLSHNQTALISVGSM